MAPSLYTRAFPRINGLAARARAEPFLSAGDCGDTVTSVRRPAIPLLLALLIVGAVLTPLPASAHSTPRAALIAVDGATETPVVLFHEPSTDRPSLWPLALVAVALLLAGHRGMPRRALVVVLALLLAVLAVEQGVHSVHHLAAAAAADCAVAAVAGQLAAVQDDVPGVPAPALAARALLEHASTHPLGARLGPDPARAPPLAIA